MVALVLSPPPLDGVFPARAEAGVAGFRTEAQGREGDMGKTFGLKPLEDRIAVLPGDEEQATVSGIVIPDTAK